MKVLLRFWAFLFFGLSLPFAHAPLFAKTPEAVSNGPAIWRVSGGKGEIFLLGSVHLMKQDADWMTPAIEKAYQQSDEVVLELDLDDIGPQELAGKVQAAGRYPDGAGGLASRIGPATYQRFLNAAAAIGLDGRALDGFKPWFVALILANLTQQREGYDESLGVDRTFLARASGDGKPVTGLETIEDQIAALSVNESQSEDEQLTEILDDLARASELTATIADAWRRGDLDELRRLIDKELEDEPEAYDALLKRRNAAWTETLATMLGTARTYLVVVGAAHVVGPDSVVSLLREKGFQVTRE